VPDRRGGAGTSASPWWCRPPERDPLERALGPAFFDAEARIIRLAGRLPGQYDIPSIRYGVERHKLNGQRGLVSLDEPCSCEVIDPSNADILRSTTQLTIQLVYV